MSETAPDPTALGRVIRLRPAAASPKVLPGQTTSDSPRGATPAPAAGISATVESFPTEAARDWAVLERAIQRSAARKGLPEHCRADVCKVMRQFWEFMEMRWRLGAVDSQGAGEADPDQDEAESPMDRLLGLVFGHVDDLKAALWVERLNREIEFQIVLLAARYPE